MCSSFMPSRPPRYDHVRDIIAPALLKEREKGKFRYLGITETAPNDPEQHMLNRAMQDDAWDTAMVAFHLMDQVARTQVFPHTLANRIGTLMMFAVRGIFARPAQLAATMRELAAAGQVPAWLAETDDPLGFLIHPEGASSLTDAAYRYVRHEPGVDVVLFGTGDAAHLRTNIASILKPPLPDSRSRETARPVQPPARRRPGSAAGRGPPDPVPGSPAPSPAVRRPPVSSPGLAPSAS